MRQMPIPNFPDYEITDDGRSRASTQLGRAGLPPARPEVPPSAPCRYQGRFCDHCPDWILLCNEWDSYHKMKKALDTPSRKEWDRAMTKEEFETNYAHRSGMFVEDLRALGLFAIPCDCENEGCKGWQMVSQVQLDVRHSPIEENRCSH